MTTVPEDYEGLGYLEKTKTREGFLSNKFWVSKSNRTVHNCKEALKSFDRFVFTKFGKDSTEKVISDLKKLPIRRQEQAVIDLFQAFLQWKNQESMASTSRLYYRIVNEYFAYFGFKITQHDLKRNIRLPKDPRNLRHPITVSEIKKLVDFSKPQRKALYTVLVSSGMRIGEAVGLRKRDFDFSLDRICITIPANLTKKRIQRQTYISKEAESYLLPLVKRLNQDELVFGSNENNERAVANEELIFWNLRKQVGLDQKYDNSRMYKINIHSFRAFCETHASNVHGVEYAHALIGHSGYLDQYYRIIPEERLDKYKKLESYLTIGDDYRKSVENENLKFERTERIDKLEEKLAKVTHKLDLVMKTMESKDS